MKRQLARKLAVILHADVVGSTGLVRRDESVAHRRIGDAFDRLSSAVRTYGGEPREIRGDALLAEFQRASDAVLAALAFQASNLAVNAAIEDEIRPEVRIGVALGEVVSAGANLTGAGVIVAQRLEQIAPPNRVVVQGAVREATPDRVPVEFAFLGEQVVKGFDEPVRAYGVDLRAGEPVPAPDPRGGWPRVFRGWRRVATVATVVTAIVAAGFFAGSRLLPSRSGHDPPETSPRPSVAVLLLKNLSGNSDEDYISAGITEDVISAIGRYKTLSVKAFGAVLPYADVAVDPSEISRALGVRYLVEGSLRRTERRVRISARLTDGATGNVLWSERFEDDNEDLFALQDAITRRIAGTLVTRVTRAEQRRATDKPTSSQGAYDLVLRGRAGLRAATRKSNREARRLFEQAIALDPEYAAAYAWLGRAHYQMATDGWTEFPAETLARAEDLAARSLAMDPELVDALRTIARVHAIQFRLDQATTEIERAIDLNPSDAEAHGDRGLILLWAGRVDEAAISLEIAFEFDPNLRGDHVFVRGLAYHLQRRHEEAVEVLERGASRYPDYVFIPAVLVAAYARLGRMEEARRNAEKIRRLTPFFDVGSFGARFRDETLTKYFAEGLREGGL